jgi:serine/threonine protein kinase
MGFHVGQTFGDYQITAVLGAGGMGRVYKVEHCITKRTEAMKVLAAELASDVQIKRFEREMRALARLSHPNIAGLHNAVHSENQLILLMEYIEGETLESVFIAGRLPLDTGIGYIKQILSALVYAHQQGVVHRDITPANVIVTPRGDVKLTDFGLSKSYGDSLLTSCGEVLGSLPYLAPEQLKGTTQPDWRSDLYSVGAILYEHLTGEKPFGANRRLAPVLTDSEGEPTSPSEIESSLSGGWDQIIRAALARDPSRRYQSAQEFLDAIDHLAQPTSESDLPLPHLRKAGIGIAIVAGLALAGFASPVLKQFREVKPATVALPRWHIAPHHRPAGLHAVVRLHAIASARFEQFSHFVFGQNLRAAQQLGHQRDSREVLHGFHLEERLVHILAVAHRAMIAEQNRVVFRDVGQHAVGERGSARQARIRPAARIPG